MPHCRELRREFRCLTAAVLFLLALVYTFYHFSPSFPAQENAFVFPPFFPNTSPEPPHRSRSTGRAGLALTARGTAVDSTESSEERATGAGEEKPRLFGATSSKRCVECTRERTREREGIAVAVEVALRLLY